jgi:hypothetical protein
MTVSVSVAPNTPAPTPAAVLSLSADAAKLYADAVAEAKAEVAKIDAALKGEAAAGLSGVEAWLKANWAHVVTWVLAAGGGVGGLLELVKHV